MATIDELLVGLGFDYDPKDLDKFKKDLGETTESIKKLAQVAAAGAAAITAFTIASTAASDEQGKLADEIGDTVENIDALQFALERSGGSADGMTSSLRELSKRASEAARGAGEAVQVFGMLGVSPTSAAGGVQTTADLMIQISRQFQNLSRAKQIEFADKLGIRDSIRLLQQGPEAIRELIMEAEALGVTTAEDARIAAEFQDNLTNLWRIIKQGSRLITRFLAPALSDITELFQEWWKTNRLLIEQNLPEWVDNFTKLLKLLTLAAGAFIAAKLVTTLVSLIALFKGASVAALVMNATVALLPALIASALAALLLLAEDAKVFFEGGDSFIQSMIDKFPEWESQLIVIASVMATLADLTGMIFDGWSKIIELIDKINLDNIKEVLSNIPGFVLDATGLQTVSGGGIIPEAAQTVRNTASTVVDKVEIVVQGGIDSAEEIANSVFNVFQQTSEDLNSTVDQ